MQTIADQPAIILLGPFLGHVTSSSVRIWLHLEGMNVAYLTVQRRTGGDIQSYTMHFSEEHLFVASVVVEGPVDG